MIRVLVKLWTKCQYYQMDIMPGACKDVHVELCSFIFSTPGIMVITLELTFQVLICENKMNHFAIKVRRMLDLLFINFCQLRISILNFLYCGVGSYILIWGNSLFSRNRGY